MTSPLRERLRAGLTEARRERDAELAGALRTAIAAIENAEAVPTSSPAAAAVPTSEHVAGGVAGVGTGEAERRLLDEEDERGIVRAEAADLRSAARQYAAAGRSAEAAAAERVAGLLDEMLAD
jgi:uncharacterized protein YqeY